MKISVSVWALVPLLVAASGSLGEQVSKRSLTGNGWDMDGKTYDYIVIGGGTAGLAVAGRLSEDESNSVAVIEAGDSGYDDNDKFTVPSANLYDSAVNTKYDWQWRVSPQHALLDKDGNTGRRPGWPRGKVLGGSSAVNGLYYVRNSEIEQNAWADLAGDENREIWGWDNLLRGMKKSEQFASPRRSVADKDHIEYDEDSHGGNGPIHTTWPAISYPPVGAFIKTASAHAGSLNKDPYNGRAWGTYVALASMSKSDWSRSYSRVGYFDPVKGRRNLHILTGHQVVRINFDRSDRDNVRATSVNYAAKSGEDWHEVHARKEVILSGGTINNPQVLQISGIGDPDLLNEKGIDVVVNLPGVGQNLQDHLSAGMTFKPSKSSEIPPDTVTENKETDSFINTAISYVDFGKLFNDPGSIVDRLQSNLSEVVDTADVPDPVKEGYRKTYSTQVNTIFTSKVGPLEILFNLMFNQINIQAALQHPVSRGNIKIRSKDPFEAPHIDPAYLTHDADLKILREGFKLIRKLSREAPLKDHIDYETSPGDDVQSNDEWEHWIRKVSGTEYHPSCTCAMLPRSAGGVVGTDLKVYGTSNLRVIDASVPPLSVSAHLQSITYGIAEIGAELILGDN